MIDASPHAARAFPLYYTKNHDGTLAEQDRPLREFELSSESLKDDNDTPRARKVRLRGPPYRVPNELFASVCYRVAENKWFDRTVLFTILMNSLCLALYNPRRTTPATDLIQKANLELVFVVVFSIEAFTKIFAYGLVTTAAQQRKDEEADEEAEAAGKPRLPLAPRYLDVSWNRLDIIIVVTSWTYFLQYVLF